MWGFEPQQKDMVLTKGADFIQDVSLKDPQTGSDYVFPTGARVYFRVANQEWEGIIEGSLVRFKVESEVTDQVRRGDTVQFCMSTPDGLETTDWVITTGRVVRG